MKKLISIVALASLSLGLAAAAPAAPDAKEQSK